MGVHYGLLLIWVLELFRDWAVCYSLVNGCGCSPFVACFDFLFVLNFGAYVLGYMFTL